MIAATRPEELLSIAEASRRLGVSEDVIRTFVGEGKLEVVAVGKRSRVTGRSVLGLPDLLQELKPRPRVSTLEDWKSGRTLRQNGWRADANGALVAP